MPDIIRVNISAPKAFVEELKLFVSTGSISRFLVEAGREKIEREKRARAVKELRSGGPALPDIVDSAVYVGHIRAESEERRTRLGL
jgi:hypothetical protein